MSESVYTFRFFGLTETALRERLTDILHLPSLQAEIETDGWDATLRLRAADSTLLDEVAQIVRDRANVYVYSDDGSDLPTRVVHLLEHHNKTIALAESCTGGMIAAAVTGVAGASRVFGTGVVSYSGTCKEKMLRVRRETLRQHGAVSAQTVGEMARGVRAASGASIGVSVTGEAGPHPAEQAVGTVYIALADGRRTWVQQWHLDAPGADRESIRRAAMGYALDLVRRYLEAYPTVMAGGDTVAEAPPPQRSALQRLPSLLPQRGDSRRRRAVKILAWIAALLVLVGGIIALYQYLTAPRSNRELQDNLRDIYRGDLLSNTDDLQYPEGMMAQFHNLYDRNVSVAGWLRIRDTVIDYPVMLYDGGYYQTHSFADELSYYGQPYINAADYDTLLRDERVRIVYGNNTGDEQMFSTLLSYRRPAFLRQNAEIEFNTLFRTASYEIVAVMAVDGGDDAVWQYAQTTFADDAAYEAYIAAIQARSLFDCDASVTAQDRLLLLSTNAQQEYGYADACLVIVARQITADRPAQARTYRWNTDVRMPEGWQSRRTTTQAARSTTTTVQAESTTTAREETTTQTTHTTATQITQAESTETQTTTAPSLDEDVGADMETEDYDHSGD